jgi:hypothetical protein
MKYSEFKQKTDKFPIISSSQVMLYDKNRQVIRNQLTRWEKKGLIIKLRKGLYVLNESDRKLEPSRLFMASQVYPPSYISMEYSLGIYGLIPEKVADITSLTTRKTCVFSNLFGKFVYQNIKKEAFCGFIGKKDENGFPYFIALPEKAVVDFLYLNLAGIKENDKEVFRESFRFQHTEQLNRKKLMKFAVCFSSKKLIEVVKTFCVFLGSEND